MKKDRGLHGRVRIKSAENFLECSIWTKRTGRDRIAFYE